MKRWQRLTVFLILLLGFSLKLHNYTLYPQRGATSDEYTYSFLGLSLLTEGVPISWSHFGAYKNREEVIIDTINFPLVRPYFDHPPLAGLFVGGWALLRKEDTFTKVTLATIRLVPIVFSSISAIFVYRIAMDLFGRTTGLLSLVIYSIAPLFVVSHRVVVSENILTAFFLAMVFFYNRLKKKMNTKTFLLLGSLAGFGFLTKELGIVIFLSLIVFFWIDRLGIKNMIRITTIFLFFVLCYLAYGYAYDGQLFWNIFSLQSARDVGPQTLWYILSTPIVINKIYHDGWYYLGVISIVLLLWERRHRYTLITVPFFTYLVILVASLTKEGQSGWYLIPLFPFLAIAAGYSIVSSIQRRSLFFLYVVLFIGLFLVEQLFIPAFGLVPFQLRFLTAILLVPTGALLKASRNRLAQKFLWVWTIMLLLGTVVTTINYKHPA